MVKICYDILFCTSDKKEKKTGRQQEPQYQNLITCQGAHRVGLKR